MLIFLADNIKQGNRDCDHGWNFVLSCRGQNEEVFVSFPCRKTSTLLSLSTLNCSFLLPSLDKSEIAVKLCPVPFSRFKCVSFWENIIEIGAQIVSPGNLNENNGSLQ